MKPVQSVEMRAANYASSIVADMHGHSVGALFSCAISLPNCPTLFIQHLPLAPEPGARNPKRATYPLSARALLTQISQISQMSADFLNTPSQKICVNQRNPRNLRQKFSNE